KSYPKKHKKQKPSELIKGAFYAAREECRSNPDWMSQAANSLRDLLYPLFSPHVGEKNVIRLFKEFATDLETQVNPQQEQFVKVFAELNTVYGKLSDLAHHGTEPRSFTKNEYMEFSEEDFESLLRDFVSILRKAFSLQQVYVHIVLDLIVEQGPKNVKEEVKTLIGVNADARQYFYTNLDENWLKWLWYNDFLEMVKDNVEDPTQYSQRTPELGYLISITEKKPKVITEEILLDDSTATNKENFNPEVVDTFLRICQKLPAKQLKKVVPKIRDENWVKLMGGFDHLGYLYQELLDTLSTSGRYDSLLVLAEALLSLRPSSAIEKIGSMGDNPFYIDDLSRTEVFDHLIYLEGVYAERAFEMIASKLEKIFSSLNPSSEDSFFEKEDNYLNSDVDFFNVKFDQDDSYKKSDNVRRTFLALGELAKRVIGGRCEQEEKISRLYEENIEELPHSRVTWRFKLYALSLCPQVFLEEFIDKLFTLFDTKKYFEIMTGAEYEKALREVFPELPQADKSAYVNEAVSYFSKLAEESEEKEDKKSCLNQGSRLFSLISSELTEDERQKIEANGFDLLSDYKPGVAFEFSDYGFYSPKGPIDQEEFDKLPVSEVASKLKSEWTPENLEAQDKDLDFKEPINTDGVAKLLKKSINNRLQDFVDKAEMFFEPGSLDSHYTYSFLQGIRTAISEDEGKYVGINWDGLIEMMLQLKTWGYENSLQKEQPESDLSGKWRGNWKAVHSILTDVLQELVKKDEGEILVDSSKRREELLSILEYLLKFPYPREEDEEPESATERIRSAGKIEPKVSNPFDMAINSVRGGAFEAFVYFVYRDGKELKEDIKEQYESLLEQEETRALYFMFGHYLPTFYFRDEEWFKSLLPLIFPDKRSEEHLYLAAWEGYLANKLYCEIFFDPEFQNLYERSIEGVAELKQEEKHRQFFKDPEERTADHLALAHIYFEDFGKDHSLFEIFLDEGSLKQHAKFISFLGRHFVSNLNESAEDLLKTKDWPPKRLKEIWKIWLDRYDSQEILEKFGRWVN
ncbi:MAG: hypothetical protein V5A57_03495, partial [Candidatus Paceibacterota bacterium]